jgi:hypothetical protein
MATKKKLKKKSMKSKKTARKKAAPAKTAKRPKKAAKKKPVARKAKKQIAEKKKAVAKKPTRKKSAGSGDAGFSLGRSRSRSEEQSGDLQGLSRREGADSESVDELIEEGNAFEADVVAGVESADDADEQEVHTHEVPEDDVPGEYLDEE